MEQAKRKEALQDCNQGAFWDDGKRPLICYLGFDWTEENRLVDIRREKPQYRWMADARDSDLG